MCACQRSRKGRSRRSRRRAKRSLEAVAGAQPARTVEPMSILLARTSVVESIRIPGVPVAGREERR